MGILGHLWFRFLKSLLKTHELEMQKALENQPEKEQMTYKYKIVESNEKIND